ALVCHAVVAAGVGAVGHFRSMWPPRNRTPPQGPTPWVERGNRTRHAGLLSEPPVHGRLQLNWSFDDYARAARPWRRTASSAGIVVTAPMVSSARPIARRLEAGILLATSNPIPAAS